MSALSTTALDLDSYLFLLSSSSMFSSSVAARVRFLATLRLILMMSTLGAKLFAY